MNDLFNKFLQENNLVVIEKDKEIEESTRDSPKYREWRKQVLERDGHKCQCCGGDKHLVTHHIFSYKEYPLLRCSVDNGITLCKWCHGKYHSYYGKKANARTLMEHYKRFECMALHDNLGVVEEEFNLPELESEECSLTTVINDVELSFMDTLEALIKLWDGGWYHWEGEPSDRYNVIPHLINELGISDSENSRKVLMDYINFLFKLGVISHEYVERDTQYFMVWWEKLDKIYKSCHNWDYPSESFVYDKIVEMWVDGVFYPDLSVENFFDINYEDCSDELTKPLKEALFELISIRFSSLENRSLLYVASSSGRGGYNDEYYSLTYENELNRQMISEKVTLALLSDKGYGSYTRVDGK
jgi:hypothetical protein